SLVSVFPALGLGILVGSAVGKPTIVDNLNREINRVDKKADTINKQNAQLRGQNGQLGDYISATAPALVQGRLEGMGVVVVAVSGVSGKTVSAMLALLHQAGAIAPATVWLQPQWELNDETTVATLARDVGSDEQHPAAVREDALDALVTRL